MDKGMLMETGRRKGLTNMEHIEKDYLQDMLLHGIFKKTSKLVFKGGTALYKIYGLPRFSEDLDFTMLEDFDVDELVKDVIKTRGEIKSSRRTRDSLLIKIGFKGILTDYNTLRMDLSIKNDVLCGVDVRNYVPEFIDINPFSLKVLKLREMAAEKIHSIMAREKARDLYDLFFLLRMSEFDRELAERKLAIFGMKFTSQTFRRRVSNLESIWQPELKPFVMQELPNFRTVCDFVIGKIC